ncbi:MAG: tRNA pseudouridine(38-40) synthase TruA [Actinomycetota bacterium]
MSRVVRLLLAYDGTGFRGWARQRRDVRTVQGLLEEVLSHAIGEPVALSVAGRTDAGVHATGQVASFVAPQQWPDTRTLDGLRRRVNAQTAPEVVVREASWAAEGFDARFSATARVYRYRIDTGDAPDPFAARFTWHRVGAVGLGRMRAGARHLAGEHDFASFCRAPQGEGTTVRRVERLTVSRSGEVVEVVVRANAFCHQMVRALVGTLVGSGAGTLDPESVPRIIEARDRHAAPQIAPPHGLTLERVVYAGR